jgi:hypothetical protein
MANTDPILTSESSVDRGFWNKGSLQVDGAFILPQNDSEFTNPDLREEGRLKYGSDEVLAYRNSEKFVKLYGEMEYNFKAPEDFPFVPLSILEMNGKFYPNKSNWDLVKNKVSQMIPYYLNYVSGSNSNNGSTPALAFKTLSYAISQGARLIYLSGGDIIQNDGWGNIVHNLNEDVFVITKGERPAFVLNNLTGVSYSIESGTTYQATISAGTYPNIVDFEYVDNYGYPLSLIRKTSLADVNSNPNSYYITGTTLYVNLLDGRSPDSSVHVLKTTTDNYFASQNQMYFYAENICFIGGNNAFAVRAQNSTGAAGLISLLKKCHFMNANVNGMAHTINPGVTWSEDCVAYRNGRDGFNYSQGNNYTTGRFIEVGNQGFSNGVYTLDLASANNGTSAHNNIKGWRINCKYFDNVGPNVADVNGAMTVNVGLECFNSLGFDDSGVDPLSQGINWADWGDFGVGTISTESGAKMWLYGCNSQDGRLSFFTPEFLADNVTPDDSEMFIDQRKNTSGYSGTITFGDFVSGASEPYEFPALSSFTVYNPIDSTPTDGSTNAVSSNGVFDALVLKAPINNASMTGTFTLPNGALAITSGSTSNYIRGNGSASNFGSDVRSIPLAGFVAGAGTVASSDTILQAFNKLAGNQALKADLASPALTGTPTAPTATTGTNTMQLSTTAFVQQELAANNRSILNDSYTTVKTTAELEADYPSVPLPYYVIAKNTTGNPIIYIKHSVGVWMFQPLGFTS